MSESKKQRVFALETLVRLSKEYHNLSLKDQLNLQVREHGVDVIYVAVYTNDCASGAINSGKGRHLKIVIPVVCTPENHALTVARAIYPNAPSASVYVGDNCIYRSWYEFAGAETTLSPDMHTYIKACILVGADFTEFLVKCGYTVKSETLDHITIQKGCYSPTTIRL